MVVINISSDKESDDDEPPVVVININNNEESDVDELMTDEFATQAHVEPEGEGEHFDEDGPEFDEDSGQDADPDYDLA